MDLTFAKTEWQLGGSFIKKGSERVKKYKKIGILGGMGPEATTDLYMKIIREFQKKQNAKYDCDFPEIIIDSIPLPDIIESEIDESEISEMLINGCQLLQSSKADFIVIPCNSVHKYIEEMRESVDIPVSQVPCLFLFVSKLNCTILC